ncbi:CPBP family intramembrane metalloprotease [candidate division WOR-3 bacterium]|nr:CPBP family intramembrane metalloprotease [candidate division WOR-3 bacterium]
MSIKKICKIILYSTLAKIFLGIALIILSFGTVNFVLSELLNLTSLNKDITKLITGICSSAVSLLSYWFLYRIYEKRKITELSKDGFVKYVPLGIGLGALLQSLTVFVIHLFNGYTIEKINPVFFLIPPLTMALSSAVFEEILFRGIFFRIVEDRLGSYASIIISSSVFGAMHLGNPNSSLAGIALVVQAGLLLAASYIFSRNLWFPIAIHFSWNYTQSAIFGANVSGHELSKTLINSEIKGPAWITGGEFGPEGSLQSTFFCLIASVILLVLSHRKGKIKKFLNRTKDTQGEGFLT